MENRAARTPWPVVLGIVLACVCLAVLLSWLITSAAHPSVGNATPLGIRASLDVDILDDGVIYYDGAMIGALDARGNLKWNYSAGTNAQYDVSQDGVAGYFPFLYSERYGAYDVFRRHDDARSERHGGFALCGRHAGRG